MVEFAKYFTTGNRGREWISGLLTDLHCHHYPLCPLPVIQARSLPNGDFLKKFPTGFFLEFFSLKDCAYLHELSHCQSHARTRSRKHSSPLQSGQQTTNCLSLNTRALTPICSWLRLRVPGLGACAFQSGSGGQEHDSKLPQVLGTEEVRGFKHLTCWPETIQ